MPDNNKNDKALKRPDPLNATNSKTENVDSIPAADETAHNVFINLLRDISDRASKTNSSSDFNYEVKNEQIEDAIIVNKIANNIVDEIQVAVTERDPEEENFNNMCDDYMAQWANTIMRMTNSI